MSFKRYLLTRAVTMFGVLMATLLVTIALVGSNMDAILKQSVAFEIRQQVTDNKALVQSFSSPEDLDSFIKTQIEERTKALGLDEPWYSPQRLGMTVYK